MFFNAFIQLLKIDRAVDVGESEKLIGTFD